MADPKNRLLKLAMKVAYPVLGTALTGGLNAYKKLMSNGPTSGGVSNKPFRQGGYNPTTSNSSSESVDTRDNTDFAINPSTGENRSNRLKQIGGKKAKSLGKEAKPLKPSVKKVNTLGRGDLAPRIPTSTGRPDYLKIEAKNLLMDNPVVKDATSQRSSESSNKRKVVKTKTVTKEGGKRKVYKTKTVSKG